jgi:tRNA-specific 2-thiouridylase
VPSRHHPEISPLTSAATNPSCATRAGEETLERLRAWPGKHRVAVGLSGGVDSSLTAALLVKAGWEVEGLTLWLMSGKGACCAEGLVDAAALCEQLAIRHHVVDSRENFKEQIVDFLISGYSSGVTPLPCSRCNRSVKFGPMIAWAESEQGIERIATGHYARVRPGLEGGRTQLLRGLDRSKDQSYFLYDLPQKVLSRLVFPLGEMNKTDTRAEAAHLGLRTATKAESQDLCLADHHGSMKAFLDAYLPPRKGEITLPDGKVIGEHDGIEHFTIGQRKGLGVAWKEPLHVVRLDGASNRVIVATREQAGRISCTVGSINWVSIEPLTSMTTVMVQVRYRSEPVEAELRPMSQERCKLTFREPQFSLTPGQAAVWYSEDLLLGGGLIEQIEGAMGEPGAHQ